MGDLLRFDPIARRIGTEPARRRLDQLVEADDARARIRELEPLYLYGLVQEVGLAEALPVLHEVSGEQAQALVDFDCWEGDALALDRLEAWLAAHLQGSFEHAAEVNRHLDPELLGVLVKTKLQVYFYEDEDDAEQIDRIEGPVESSPDGVYAIVMPEDEREAELLRGLLRYLYADDQDQARQLLHHARWDLASQLEETAHQMRAGRLEEAGFLPLEEAVAIYAPVRPAEQRGEAQRDLAADREPLQLVLTGPVAVPVAVADDLLRLTDEGGGSFVGTALRRLADRAPDTRQADQLLLQLRSLINRSVVADHGRPGDPDDTRAALARVHAVLNLGLEYLTARDLEQATRLVERWPLKRVFRTGFSLVASLAGQAYSLAEQGQLSLVEELPQSLCTIDEAALVEGLLSPRPLRSAADGLGFSSLAEVEAAAGTLALLAYKAVWTFGVSGLTRDALLDVVAAVDAGVGTEDVTFDALLATRAALAVLGESGDLRLLGLDELRRLVSDHLEPDALSEPLAAALASVAQPPQSAARSAGPMAERWVTDVASQLVEGYGALTAEALAEPEYLPALLLWRR